jgi:putative endonuclease
MDYVYILECADNTLYAGYTNNLDNRLKVHNLGKGSKYTRARLPVKLVYSENAENKSDALKREYQIKQMTRKQKDELIKSMSK